MAALIRIFVIILLIFISYFIILQVKMPSCFKPPQLPMPISEILLKPVVKIYDLSPSDSHLHIVKSVFSQLGYRVLDQNATSWNILWSHPYPFYSLHYAMAHLKPHQKVNHFPGSGYITQKANLVLLNITHVPKAFVLPEQKDMFISYSEKHVSKLWVQKSNSHRGIQIIDAEKIDLNKSGTFIQEFVSKPLLINGRKFDIGVYVAVTSIDPLRVYIYSGDILLRFCTMQYYPFDSSDVESYVVGDDYLPIWKVPDLKRYYTDLNYSGKESLNAYLLAKKKNPKKMWAQISTAISDMYQKAEEEMIYAAYKLGNLRNFFELIRVDFVVDEDLNVYVLEANMSPNLSADHFPPNRQLYEHVLFNTLSIVGLVRKYPDTIISRNDLEVSEKDISVFVEECNSRACNSSCKIQKCRVCNFCMTKESNTVAYTAYYEHMNRNKFRRVMPVPIDFKSPVQPTIKTSELSEMNQFMDRWFKGKCLQDVTFCQ